MNSASLPNAQKCVDVLRRLMYTRNLSDFGVEWIRLYGRSRAYPESKENVITFFQQSHPFLFNNYL